MNLYEYACESCDVIMQMQLSKTIDIGMGCICGSAMNKVFHIEIDESVFGEHEDSGS